MNLIFGCFDRDPIRRRHVVEVVESSCSTRPGTATRRFEHGSGTIVARTSPVVPLDQANDPSGWSFVAGNITAVTQPAARVLQQAEKAGPAETNGQSGFYLACHVGVGGDVTITSDVLGLFPIYWWANDEVLLFASEPAAIHADPRVPRRLSLPGLAGILLQSHMANGQTLWEGIRRPDAGIALCWQPGRACRSVTANPLVPHAANFEVEYGTARRMMSETLDASVRACAGDRSTQLMLSGGLDSRLVAGYLDRFAHGRTRVFLFGDTRDVEVRCAAKVRRALRMPANRSTIRYERFVELARRCIEREQLSNTLCDFAWPSGMEDAPFAGRELVSGLYGDAVIGATTVAWAENSQTGELGFDPLLKSVTCWGFSPDEVTYLLAVESARTIVDEVIDGMRTRFDALPGEAFQKSWLWSMQNRIRHHVTPYAWRLGLRVWPMTPYADRRLLELAASLPLGYMRERRLQRDTLVQEFPRLARLPLDRNSLDCSPIVPTLASRIAGMNDRFLRRLQPSGPDRRLYFRQYDINNPGWRAIRSAAEPCRGQTRDVLRQDAIARLLPPASADIVGRSTIRDTAGRKTLCALLMLLGERTAR